MGLIGPTLVPGANLMMRYSELLLAGIEPKQFARFAPGAGGKPIQSNHPAFVFGHLSIYPHRAAMMLGKESAVTAVPAGFEDLFKPGVECRDDPEGSIYPPMKTITDYYFRSHKEALAMLAATDDSVFGKPNPNEGRSRETFPTIGSAVAFYMGGHAQMHLGQASAWRRAMGMPSAM